MTDTVSPALSKRLSEQFRYSEDSLARIVPLCIPQPNWLADYPMDLIDELGTNEQFVVRVLENRADRFLNTVAENKRPATKVEQRKYLEAVDYHITSLLQLLVGVRSIDGSTADPWKFFERVNAKRGKPYKAWQHRDVVMKELIPIQVFVRWRLQNDLKPIDDEKLEEETKRRKTFPRFCFLADLLAAYQRITGKPGAATVHDSRYSEVIQFILETANPVLKVAQQPLIDAETVKKEIQSIKSLWRQRIRPEMTYVLPDWGKHNMQNDVGTNP